MREPDLSSQEERDQAAKPSTAPDPYTDLSAQVNAADDMDEGLYAEGSLQEKPRASKNLCRPLAMPERGP